jgi:hypothetical protein
MTSIRDAVAGVTYDDRIYNLAAWPPMLQPIAV